MNDYGGRLPGENEAQNGGGSVRRARERMEAGLPQDNSPVKPGYEQRSNAPSPPNPNRKQVPQEAKGSSIGENAIGVAISRPIPAPQWPLMDATIPQQFASDPSYRPPPGRAIAPQRPPRPSRVPSILDSSQPQDHVPSFAYNVQSQRKPPRTPQYPDEDLFSPDPRSPETPSGSGSSGSSRPSTMSSVGTIPDFPLPTISQGPRRSGNLGPPPSSRRGASSYYSSHASYVSPIPEESPRTQRSHSSYASSAAIPSSWGSASPGYYYDEQSPDEDERIMSEHGIIDERGESRESNYDGNEEQSLVRQASVGKRGKPALINTKSTENVDATTTPEPLPQQDNNPSAPGLWGLRDSRAPEAAVAAAVAAGFAVDREAGIRDTTWPTKDDLDSNLNPKTIPNIPPDPTAYDPNRPSISTESVDPTTASSETIPTVGRALSSSERMSYRPAPRPQVPRVPERSDARASRIIGADQAASALNPSDIPVGERGFSRLSAIRRPPRLDIDAVRDAEARGSLTSLPDLIKRATRLAAMMDKGRRPASRFDWTTSPGGRSMVGMERHQRQDWMELPPGTRNELTILDEKNQSSNLGSMLAAFPAPGVATPTRETESRPMPQSPKLANEQSSFDLSKDQKRGRKQRRCCGLPLCGFLVIFVIVLLAVVAGIVVPIELLIVHKSTPTASTQLTLASCIAEVTCLNGGKNDISSGVCSCICVNGFTGATCASDADTVGCTTADIGGTTSVNNVTLGNSLPRLIQQAESNFTVPLASTIILSRLNTANLSCVSQNALVTFNGVSDRSASSSSAGSGALPVVQAVSVGVSVFGGIDITLTVAGGGGRAAATASETIALAGTSTSKAAANSVTVELGSTTANANTVTVGLSGTPSTTAAAAARTSSVTIDLEGSSTAPTSSVTVNLGSTTISSTTSATAITTASTTAATTATAVTSAASSATSTTSFAATQQMLDFSRIAVLYVLQQQNLSTAATAQTDLQQFLSSSSSTTSAAKNISLSNGNSIDLIDFAVNVGNGNVGALTSTASKRMRGRRDFHSHDFQAL